MRVVSVWIVPGAKMLFLIGFVVFCLQWLQTWVSQRPFMWILVCFQTTNIDPFFLRQACQG